MSDANGAVFVPAQSNPAKVKDRALCSFVTSGKGAFNAKEGRLLLLPLGLEALGGVVKRLSDWIVSQGGVMCGGAEDHGHLRSLAERYMRDHRRTLWGAHWGYQFIFARFDSRGEVSIGKPDLPVLEVQEVEPGGLRRLWVVPSHGDALTGRELLGCQGCGALWSGDSPLEPQVEPGEMGDLPPMEEVHTPSTSTIEDLCRFLGVEPRDTIKTVALMEDGGGRLAAGLVPGDMGLSYAKASRALGYRVVMADDRAVRSLFGPCAGYLGPVGIQGGDIIAHDSLRTPRPMVAGANRVDHHLRNVVPLRDFRCSFADLGVLTLGSPCPRCGGSLAPRPVRVVGEVTIPDDPGEMGFTVSSREGRESFSTVALGRVDLVALLLAMEESES
jgi:prolyl-tRNA synthetase